MRMGSSGTGTGTAVEKREEQLRNEIDELRRQQREVSQSLHLAVTIFLCFYISL